MTSDTDTNQKPKNHVRPQDKAFDEIKFSANLSLGRIEHSNLSGCLENSTLSFKKYFQARR
jgi:hypothetical protein